MSSVKLSMNPSFHLMISLPDVHFTCLHIPLMGINEKQIMAGAGKLHVWRGGCGWMDGSRRSIQSGSLLSQVALRRMFPGGQHEVSRGGQRTDYNINCSIAFAGVAVITSGDWAKETERRGDGGQRERQLMNRGGRLAKGPRREEGRPSDAVSVKYWFHHTIWWRQGPRERGAVGGWLWLWQL